MIKIANDPEYADLSPSKIDPMLPDEGRYIASESNFYRVLKAPKQLSYRHRHRSRICHLHRYHYCSLAPSPNCPIHIDL
jgi:hypothetical protein